MFGNLSHYQQKLSDISANIQIFYTSEMCFAWGTHSGLRRVSGYINTKDKYNPD